MPHAVKAPKPLSIRLSVAERAELDRRAGDMPVSAYVKARLFGEAYRPASRARRRMSADRVLLAQILGQLGGSGLSASLREMARAAETGSLHVDDLTASYLRDACNDVRNMHLRLLVALGMKVPEASFRPETLRAGFARASADWRDQ